MGKTLVITEKPSQARALRQGLRMNFQTNIYKNNKNNINAQNTYYENDSIVIVPAAGHLFSLYDVPDYLIEEGIIERKTDGKYSWREFQSEIPYIPKTFKYKSKGGYAAAQFDLINKLLHREDIDIVYNCADPDPEGELLLREILLIAKNNKPVKRIETHSLVPSDIANAFYHPFDTNNYNHWYFEALARQQTDWLIGINYTTMLTLKTGIFFPVGRVLFPIIKFIYDCIKARENFVPTLTYGINLNFKRANRKFSLPNPEISFAKEDKDKCDALCKQLNDDVVVVTKVEKKKKKLSPSNLFSTSKLYSYMSTHYGMSMQETGDACQKLYDNGYIMYPRTDCEYLSSTEIDYTRNVIEQLADAGYPVKFHTRKSVFNDEKCQGDGESSHTAITITNKFLSDEELDVMPAKMQATYLTIFNRVIANFCDAPDIDETNVTITCGDYNFKTSGSVVNSEGFLEFEPRNFGDPLPPFFDGETISDALLETTSRKTKAPPKPNQSMLLEYLKHPFKKNIDGSDTNEDDDYYTAVKSGLTIGTEDTMKEAATRVIECGYVTLEKGVYDITAKGRTLVETLERLNFHYLDPERTIEVNKIIKQIGKKMFTLEQNKENLKWELINASNALKNSNIVINVDDVSTKREVIGKCPKCGSPVYEGEKSFYCGNKECKFFLYKENKFFESFDKKITKTMAKGFLSSKRTAKVTSIKSKKKFDENGKPKVYDANIKVDFNGDYPNFSFAGFSEKKKRSKK